MTNDIREAAQRVLACIDHNNKYEFRQVVISEAEALARLVLAQQAPAVAPDHAEVERVLAKARMECVQKYLRSYWFSFTETGCGAIDGILSWIARAGKSYHSTEYWNDAEDGDPSKIDLIQSAANDAAKIILTLADALTASLAREAEVRKRAAGEVEKAYREGQSDYGANCCREKDTMPIQRTWINSNARRAALDIAGEV